MSTSENRRILLGNDLASIHEDFRRIFSPTASSTDWEAHEALLFGPPTSGAPSVRFEMEFAFQ